MAQLMPLPNTVPCFSKIQIGLPFWYRLTRVVTDKGPLNVCVCVRVRVYVPCVSGTLSCSRVLLPACCCSQQLAYSCQGKDRVLLIGIIYTISVPLITRGQRSLTKGHIVVHTCHCVRLSCNWQWTYKCVLCTCKQWLFLLFRKIFPGLWQKKLQEWWWSVDRGTILALFTQKQNCLPLNELTLQTRTRPLVTIISTPVSTYIHSRDYSLLRHLDLFCHFPADTHTPV